jgi:hypothetical protein
MALTIIACGGNGSAVDPVLRWDIPAHGCDQQQQWNTGPGSAIAPPHDGMPGKALAPVLVGIFPDLGQRASKPLMRLVQIWIDGERCLILQTRHRELTRFAEQVSITGMRHLVAGMT